MAAQHDWQQSVFFLISLWYPYDVLQYALPLYFIFASQIRQTVIYLCLLTHLHQIVPLKLKNFHTGELCEPKETKVCFLRHVVHYSFTTSFVESWWHALIKKRYWIWIVSRSMHWFVDRKRKYCEVSVHQWIVTSLIISYTTDINLSKLTTQIIMAWSLEIFSQKHSWWQQ